MIDCDVHQNFNDVSDLLPWIDPAYRDYMLHAGFGGFDLPNYLTWIQPHGFTRGDSVPPDGGVPGSDYETMRKQLLDPLDVEYAILTGEDILSISSLPNPQLAAALATAYNRWLIDEWLPRDSRLKGSLVVATQDAERAAEEIRAFGHHPGVVQVLLPCSATTGYGHPQYHPIYEAAVEVGLPVAMHVGGEGLGINPPPTSTGYPSYYIEWHVLLIQCAMSHVVSFVCHGVFEKYPEFRVAMIEVGFTWLPTLLWRLDTDWRALRSEVPWVKWLPSETVRAQKRPIVVITSNNEKELPDAFLRRCFFHYIKFPDADTMGRIVDVHFPNIKKRLVEEALRIFFEVREVPGLKKKPSTSELLDWLKLLLNEDITPEMLRERDPRKLIPPLHGALLKNEQDVHLFERLAFLSRREV